MFQMKPFFLNAFFKPENKISHHSLTLLNWDSLRCLGNRSFQLYCTSKCVSTQFILTLLWPSPLRPISFVIAAENQLRPPGTRLLRLRGEKTEKMSNADRDGEGERAGSRAGDE